MRRVFEYKEESFLWSYEVIKRNIVWSICINGMEKEEEKGYIGMIGNEVREKVKGRVFIEI